MAKKELPTTIRPMQGFPVSRQGKKEDEDQTALISQLRASLAKLEAENSARKEAQRARLAKHRDRVRASKS